MYVIAHDQACPELVEGTADHILDLCPGVQGGEVVAQGTPEPLCRGDGELHGAVPQAHAGAAAGGGGEFE